MASTCFDLYLYNFMDSKKHISDLQRYYTTALFLSGVSPVVVGNRLFIIGGYLPNQSISNKICEVDLSLGRFTDVAELPVPIYNYSAAYYNNHIYIYGGIDSSNNVYNRLFRFNVNDFSITELMSGPSRECHSSFVFDGRIYIFGGKNSSGIYSDMYCYDPALNSWIPVNYSSQNNPQGRYEHKGVLYHNKYYIFGGAGSGNVIYNDMWRYDPVDKSWTNLNPSGTIPPKRFDHTMIVYGNKIYLHAGFNIDKGYLNDTYIYSFSDNRWDPSNDTTPVARSDHGCFIYDKYLVVFGGIGPCDVVMGVDIYDLEKDIWISSCCENNCVISPGATVLPVDDPHIGAVINLAPSSISYNRIQIRNNKGTLEIKNPTGPSSISSDKVILGSYRFEYDSIEDKLKLYKGNTLIQVF